MTAPVQRRKSGVIELLAKLQSGEVRPAAITLEERRSCVNYLRLEGYTQEEMAKIFGVHRATIGRDEALLAERAGQGIADIKTKEVAAGLIAWAKHLTAKAMKAKNHALVWRIQKELTEKLEELGIIAALPRASDAPTQWVAVFGRETNDEDHRLLPAPEDADDAEYEDDVE